jgi:hypothetical protein
VKLRHGRSFVCVSRRIDAGREVHDGVDAVGAHDREQVGRGAWLEKIERLEATGDSRSTLVDDDDVMPLSEQLTTEGRADEAAAADERDLHGDAERFMVESKSDTAGLRRR